MKTLLGSCEDLSKDSLDYISTAAFSRIMNPKGSFIGIDLAKDGTKDETVVVEYTPTPPAPIFDKP